MFVAAYIVYLAAIPKVYYINDDLAIERLVSTGGDTVFLNPVLGNVLHWIESVFLDTTSAYALFLYFGLGLVGIHLVTLARQLHSRVWRAFLWLMIIYVVGFHAITITFTIVAFLLAGTVALRLLVRGDDTPHRLGSALLYLQLLLAFLIRDDAGALGVAVICLGAGLNATFGGMRPPLRTWISMAVVFVTSVSMMAVFVEFIASDVYRNFVEFNALRGLFHDNPIVALNANNTELLAQMGWTKEDYRAFQSWTFFDERIYNVDTLSILIDEGVRPGPVDAFTGFLPGLREVAAAIVEGYPIPVYTVGVVLLWLLLRGSLRAAFAVAAHVVGGLVILVLLNLFLRTPDRIIWPLLICIAVSSVVTAGSIRPPQDRKALRVRAAMLIALAGIVSIASIHVVPALADRIKGQLGSNDRSLRRMNELTDLVKDKLALVDVRVGQRVYGGKSPLSRYPETLRESVLPGGWMTFTPLFYDVLGKRTGLDRAADLIEYAADRSDVVLILDDGHYEVVAENYLRVHHPNVTLVRIRNAGTKRLGMYRVVSSTAATGFQDDRREIDRGHGHVDDPRPAPEAGWENDEADADDASVQSSAVDVLD